VIHNVIRTIEIYDFTDLFDNVVVLCKIIIMSQFLHILRINLSKHPCWLLFEHACVLSSLVFTIVIAMVVYVRVGWRFKNKGEVLLAYGRVCFGAFKHQHRLPKIAQCTFNSIYLKENNVKIFTV